LGFVAQKVSQIGSTVYLCTEIIIIIIIIAVTNNNSFKRERRQEASVRMNEANEEVLSERQPSQT